MPCQISLGCTVRVYVREETHVMPDDCMLHCLNSCKEKTTCHVR